MRHHRAADADLDADSDDAAETAATCLVFGLSSSAAGCPCLGHWLGLCAWSSLSLWLTVTLAGGAWLVAEADDVSLGSALQAVGSSAFTILKSREKKQKNISAPKDAARFLISSR